MIDRHTITDPPDYPTRYEYDDTPVDMESFKLSPAEKDRLHAASRWGKSLILRARAGDQQALADLQHKLHITRLEVTHD